MSWSMQFDRKSVVRAWFAIIACFLGAPSHATAQTANMPLRFDEAKQRAENGDAYAQAVVAMHHQLGWNTEKNPELAAKYATASARAKHPLGLFRLGALMRAGEGMPKDEQKGLALQAASFDGLDRMTGDPYALTALGIMTFQGKVIGQNDPQEQRYRVAAQLYKKAADRDFAPAQFNYAMCAENGQGMPKDIRTAIRFIGMARAAEYPAAMDREWKAAVMPEISSSIAKSRLNPETFVWEPEEKKGYSSQWHDVIPPSTGGPIAVGLRPNYTEFPAYVSDSEWTFDVLHYKADTQSLFNSWQHVVLGQHAGSLQIGMPVPPMQKNVLSISEYPISLEWRVMNLSNDEIELSRLLITVSSVEPIQDVIPAAFPTAEGFIRTHNFGWGKTADVKLDLALYLDPFDGSNEGPRPFVRSASTMMPIDCVSQQTLQELFALEPHVYADLSNPNGVPAPSSASVLKSLISVQTIRGEKVVIDRASALNGKSAGMTHNRLPTDLLLPINRSGYVISFPADLVIPPKSERRFIFNFSTEASANVVCSPVFVLATGERIEGCELSIRSEVARPLPGSSPRQLFASKGQDVESYHAIVDGKEMLNVAYSRMQQKEFIPQDAPEEQALLEKETEALKKMLDEAAAVPRLRPSNQSFPVPAVFSQLFSSDPLRLAVEGWTCSIEAKLYKEVTLGVIEITDLLSRSPLSQIRWAFHEKANELNLQVTGSQRHGWIAWLAASPSGSRLYIAFPGLSECTWFLPSVEEDALQRIFRSGDGKELLVETRYGLSRYDLTSNLVRSFLRAVSLGALKDELVVATDDDLDGLMRVRLPLESGTVKLAGVEPVRARIRLAEGHHAPSTDEIQLAWISQTEVAVKRQGRWAVWDLLRGVVREVSSTQGEDFDDAAKTLAARVRSSEALVHNHSQQLGDGCWSFWPGWVAEVQLAGGKRLGISVDRGSIYGPRDLFSVALQELQTEPTGLNMYHAIGKPPRQTWVTKGGGRLNFCLGNSANAHAPLFSGAKTLGMSPREDKLVLANSTGTELFFVDLARMNLMARAVMSPRNPDTLTIVSGNYYLSGDGDADGVAIVGAGTSVPITRFEAKYNRPDIILERFGADQSVIKEARRLRERLVRRSDFKSFEGAALIDVPVVTVKTEVPEQTGERFLTLDFEASNSTGPLKELRVFNNGALVQTLGLTGKDGQPSREASGDVAIDLASGENRLQLMAVSEEGFTSAFAEKRVECTAEPDSRRCFIAAVGVSEYKDPRFNLKFAAKDAEDMSKALAEKALHRGYQPEVMVVRNAEADGTLVERLRKFLAQAGTDDEVILFFAGHGLLDKDLEYHFARHDTDFDASENMGITFQELESLVDGIKPLKRTVLFDTCHSGEVEEEDKPQLLAMVGSGDLAAAAAADTGVQVRGVATRGMKVKELEPKLRHTDFVELESLFPDSRRAKGANILTSSSGSEFSMESDAWQNGLFTYAFLNALKDEKTDANGDKTVSFSEAAAAVQDKVKTLSGGYQRPITRGVNREAEVALASFGPPVAPIPTKEKKSGWWPF